MFHTSSLIRLVVSSLLMVCTALPRNALADPQEPVAQEGQVTEQTPQSSHPPTTPAPASLLSTLKQHASELRWGQLAAGAGPAVFLGGIFMAAMGLPLFHASMGAAQETVLENTGHYNSGFSRRERLAMTGLYLPWQGFYSLLHVVPFLAMAGAGMDALGWSTVAGAVSHARGASPARTWKFMALSVALGLAPVAMVLGAGLLAAMVALPGYVAGEVGMVGAMINGKPLAIMREDPLMAGGLVVALGVIPAFFAGQLLRPLAFVLVDTFDPPVTTASSLVAAPAAANATSPEPVVDLPARE